MVFSFLRRPVTGKTRRIVRWSAPPGAAIVAAAYLFAAAPVQAAWVDFTEEASVRSSAPASLFIDDQQEKDYAWADLDKDGDIDLVNVRKQPFSNSVGRRNVLLMNEGGVLVDRTNDFAVASNDPTDPATQGFLDATPDRDVIIVDVNNDTWLDLVTAPAGAYSSLPKTISHPRVYINLGDSPPGSGNWQGFRYDEPRIPVMSPDPNFSGVGAGDVTGDGWPDLYFTDYTNTLENRLLINDGSGSFTDETDTRTYGEMNEASFATHTIIEDMNLDGAADIVVDHALGPYRFAIAYNNPTSQGFFELADFDMLSSTSAYFVSVADLNNDTFPDLIGTDDGDDRYFLHDGSTGGVINFTDHVFPGSSGVGGNSMTGDLNKDGWLDVIITDVDVDFTQCTRFTDVYRNNADGPNVTFTNDLANIPQAMLQGVHDVAIFDVDGDTWLDLVVGRCSGTQVWMNQPPFSIQFDYPQGMPGIDVPPGEPFTFQVQATAIGGGAVDTSTAELFVSVDGGPFASSSMTFTGSDLYDAQLPSAICAARYGFYVHAEMTDGTPFTDPPDAPASLHHASTAFEIAVELDDLEGDTSGWSVTNDPSLTAGAWEADDPNGTISGVSQAAPENDTTPTGVTAFVTDNGPPGGSAGANDVDGGPTYLRSPAIDLQGTDARISYQRWFFCNHAGTADADALTVEVSNDGVDWVLVEEVTDSDSAWHPASFQVKDFITPSSTVFVRFGVADAGGSITEAGVDDFNVETLECGACSTAAECNDNDACTADACDTGLCINDAAEYGDVSSIFTPCAPDGNVNATDILAVLNVIQGLGPCTQNQVDINGLTSCLPDQSVNALDVLGVLNTVQGLSSCCGP